MKKHYFTFILFLFSLYVCSQTSNPFKKLGYDILVATSSKGEFEEFHDQTDVVEIGSVLFDTKTKQIVKVLDEGQTTIDIPAATAAMSIDPMCEKYYWISPYVYCANNPIKYTDPNGDTIRVSIDGINYNYGADKNGTYGFYDSSGNIYSGDYKFINDLSSALGNLRSHDVGKALVDNLVGSTNTLTVVRGTNGADPDGTFVRWNPNMSTGGINTALNENRPSFIGLGHEMAHIQDKWNGTIDNSTWVTLPNGSTVPNAEKYATHIENQIRAEHGTPLRTHYGIQVDGNGVRSGLSGTRIIDGANNSLYYMRANGTVGRIPLMQTPFKYK